MFKKHYNVIFKNKWENPVKFNLWNENIEEMPDIFVENGIMKSTRIHIYDGEHKCLRCRFNKAIIWMIENCDETTDATEEWKLIDRNIVSQLTNALLDYEQGKFLFKKIKLKW